MKKYLILLIAMTLVFYGNINPVFAAGLLNTQYLVPSTTTPAATSVTQTVHFKPSVVTAIKQVNLKYCTTDADYAAACTAPTGLTLPATGSVTLTGFGSTVATASAASNVESVVVTTPAAETTTTDHQVAIAGITNPTAGVFFVRIQTYSDSGTTVIDNGATASVTVAQITASGIQRETLSVSIAGANGTSICDATTQNATANTATTVNFNDFNGTTAINSGQALTVSTNGVNGYTTSISANHGLLSGSTYINDAPQIADLSQGTVSTTWSAYTGLGVCASGTDAKTTMYGTSPYYYHAISNGASSVSKTIAAKTSPASNVTTNVNYKVNVDPTMAAGTYTNTVNYTVVPNY